MTVYPAIDLSQGQCVRLEHGEMARKIVYSDNPGAVARRWSDAGATFLHVVDLDGSFAGRPRNLEAIRGIIAAIDLPMQVGGGIRDIETIQAYFAAGVLRVILGTAAVRDRTFTEAALDRYGDRVVIDIGARDGRVAVQGWADVTELDALEFARTVQAAGARRIVFTDAGADGALQGPNLAAQRRMVEALDLPVIASGGITTLDDVRAVAALAPLGLEGMILGRSLYEGTLDLAEAITAAQQAARGV